MDCCSNSDEWEFHTEYLFLLKWRDILMKNFFPNISLPIIEIGELRKKCVAMCYLKTYTERGEKLKKIRINELYIKALYLEGEYQYIIATLAHEFLHLKYPNHGKEFKSQLKKIGVIDSTTKPTEIIKFSRLDDILKENGIVEYSPICQKAEEIMHKIEEKKQKNGKNHISNILSSYDCW